MTCSLARAPPLQPFRGADQRQPTENRGADRKGNGWCRSEAGAAGKATDLLECLLKASPRLQAQVFEADAEKLEFAEQVINWIVTARLGRPNDFFTEEFFPA